MDPQQPKATLARRTPVDWSESRHRIRQQYSNAEEDSAPAGYVTYYCRCAACQKAADFLIIRALPLAANRMKPISVFNRFKRLLRRPCKPRLWLKQPHKLVCFARPSQVISTRAPHRSSRAHFNTTPSPILRHPHTASIHPSLRH